MTSLFEEGIRGHHSMRGHVLTLMTTLKALERDAGPEWAAWVG